MLEGELVENHRKPYFRTMDLKDADGFTNYLFVNSQGVVEGQHF